MGRQVSIFQRYHGIVLLMLFILFLMPKAIFAQKITTFQSQIQQNFPGRAARSIIQLSDNGFLGLGWTKFGTYSTMVVFRTDSLGRPKWVKEYGSISQSIMPSQMIKVTDTTFAVNGILNGNNMLLIKINMNGNVLWSRNYGDWGYYTNETISMPLLHSATDGGFLFCGRGTNWGSNKVLGSTSRYSVRLKTNDTGGVIWATADSMMISSSGSERTLTIQNIIAEKDGGYLEAGTLGWGASNSPQSPGILIKKIDRNGKHLWSRIYTDSVSAVIGGSGDYYDLMAFQKIPGAIFIMNNYQPETQSLSLLKLDTTGKLEWGKKYIDLGLGGFNMIYDSIKKNLVLATYLDTTDPYIFNFGTNDYSCIYRSDTSGQIKSINYFPNSNGNLFGINTGSDMIPIKNGFAKIAIGPGGNSSTTGGYYIIKTDTGLNTLACPPPKYKPISFSFRPVEVAHGDSSWPLKIIAKTTKIQTLAIKSVDSVYCRPFIAWFTYTDTCADLTTQFFDSTYLGASSWSWNFGDPGSGTLNTAKIRNPGHIYKTTGRYKVTLIAGNGTNKDTITRLVNIISTAPQIVKDTAICPQDSIKLSIYGGVKYVWNNTGIINSDSTDSVVWAYPYQDTTFLGSVTNKGGCTITDTFRIKIKQGAACKVRKKISGIINQYASVSAYDTCNYSLTVDTGSYFKTGDKALLIQMTGTSMDTLNDSTFGTINDIRNAGNYEYVVIDSIAGNRVMLRYKPDKKYDVSGSMQLITVPQFTDVVVTDTLNAAHWNGLKGGILIFEATGTVFLNASIDVSGAGFRGGLHDSGGNACHKTDYVYNSASYFGAYKGEGIAVSNSAYAKGRGPQTIGGGGGDSYGSGGGGGGNAASGGAGGIEAGLCSGPLVNGGLGGFGIGTLVYAGKIFPGGGGGSGFSQNALGIAGGNGGGIIIIKAANLISYGNAILSNGDSPDRSGGINGGGGGGAGGTVFLDIQNFTLNPAIKIGGGNGGDVYSAKYCVGTGGGGSGGVLNISKSSLPSNLTMNLHPGMPGINSHPTSLCYQSANGADSGRGGFVTTGVSPIITGNIAYIKPHADLINVSIRDTGHIEVTFNKSTDPKVTGYRIFRRINSNFFKYVNTVSNKLVFPYTYTDTVNTMTDTFSYHVFPVDTCGNVSTLTWTHRSVHISAHTHSCEQVINLKWNIYSGWIRIKKQEIYRSVSGGPEKLIASLDGLAENFVDTAINYHNQYCYRVLAYDSATSAVSWSNATCMRTFMMDTAKLIAVTKIKTSGANGAVVLHWKSIANKPYLAYTQVFFAPDGKNYSLKAQIPAAQDSFVQTGINTQTSDAWYYIKTMDSCGSFSDSSAIHKTMDLTVSVGQLLHKLNWTAYGGFKVKGYKVERLEKGAFVVIDSVQGVDTFSREFPAPCNYAIRYRIVAEGYHPGELSWSDTMGRQAIDTQSPAPAKINELHILNGNYSRLNFTGSDSADVYQYVIQRAINGIWGTAGSELFTKPGIPEIFTDQVNSQNNALCYTIITLDSCLNATLTDTVCNVLPEEKSLFCKKQVQLSWKYNQIADSFDIYRSTETLNFTKIAAITANALSYTDTAVNAGTRYYYKIAAVNTKHNFSSFSDTLSAIPRIIPEADSAQIVYATVLKTDAAQGKIYVQWKRAPLNDTNARGYYIYSYDITNGKYMLLQDITNLNDTTYVHSGLNTLGKSYRYYILTYNVCEVGANSIIHKTVLLSVTNGNLKAQLNWSYYLGVGVKNYSIYKSKDGGPQYLLKDAGLDTTWIDSNLNCHHTYTYQIQAVLDNGKISFSDSVTIKAEDTTKPEPTSIQYATVTQTGISNGRILVSWNPSPSKDIQGYNIYRSSDGISWSTIAKVYPSTQLTDSNVSTYTQPYYYKIQPVDSCGNPGQYAQYHKTIHLKVQAGNQQATLRWNAYEGWPVKRYEIYRNGTVRATLVVAPAGAPPTSYTDTTTICGTEYQYQIKAIADTTTDTLISWSNTDSIRAQDSKPPQRVYIKTVTVSNPNKAATITWSPSASFDTKNYYIYRKSGLDGNLTLIDNTINTSYVDSSTALKAPSGVWGEPVDKSAGVCYYVFAQDHCRNTSPGSNEGCIIYLNAKNQPGYNDLNWNGYEHWYDGVQSYNVYKNEDNTGWNLIGTTTSPLYGGAGGRAGAFTDKSLGDSTINYCYQVEAVENPGQYNQLSRSTVVCVHQDATVFIPNTFSPFQKDDLNDYFGPKGLHIKSYTMRIYNRWGEMVFPSTSSGTTTSSRSKGSQVPELVEGGWDGTFKGKDVQEGVYIYLITVEDYNGHESYFKGNVTVLK